MDNGNQIRVLIIDDDQTMCETLKLMLEPQNFEVHAALSAIEGVEIAKKIKPDVIILDLRMPDMNGWQATETIRSFSLVPILLLSAISNPELVAKALDEGADEYLLKPVASSVLIAHLNRLVKRSRAEVLSQNSLTR